MSGKACFKLVDADNSNGRIEAEMTLPPGAACNMTTTNGSIALEIPSDTSASLDARTTNGTVRVSNLTVKDSSSRGNGLEGTLGEGDGSIFLRTTNGNIVVKGT